MSEKKETNLTEKQQAFIEALGHPEVQGDLRKAARMAGYSDQTKMTTILPGVADVIRNSAKDFLAQNSFKAVWALLNSLEAPNDPGVANKLKAAESILSRVGVKESEVSIKVPESGVVILPAKMVVKQEGEKDGGSDN